MNHQRQYLPERKMVSKHDIFKPEQEIENWTVQQEVSCAVGPVPGRGFAKYVQGRGVLADLVQVSHLVGARRTGPNTMPEDDEDEYDHEHLLAAGGSNKTDNRVRRENRCACAESNTNLSAVEVRDLPQICFFME